MARPELLANAAIYQEALRRFKVYSLQGWQELADLHQCGCLLLELSEACRGFIRLECRAERAATAFLESVEWDNEYLTLWSRFLQRVEAPASRPPRLLSEGIRFKFAAAAISRFTIVLLGTQSPRLPMYSDERAQVKEISAGLEYHMIEARTPEFVYRRALTVQTEPGVAAILWHVAFDLSPAHIEQLFQHFSRAV